jgi:hypothetical protein
VTLEKTPPDGVRVLGGRMNEAEQLKKEGDAGNNGNNSVVKMRIHFPFFFGFGRV